ncbi:helix-turn-helix domain-containing protein [Anaeromicrobium sediminis]|uniref:HTH cro/C1-type domain-containing protein n=1 Tax=Anaeromicrobium sediminis TaxID=1478221 RepID=A0A267M9U1_9FIRM|nr:helix-turn-helix transcriptional regulator [Anaeromicrobium sediminis]PAB55688.1 hypothetical protein CCE28_21630 [Anaeromicrobium sediminis]
MEETNYYIKVGQIIKDLRLKKNMSRKQLADGICSVSYISRIENGRRCPTSVILRQLTTKLGISNEDLFRLIESPSAMHVQELINQLFLYIERHDFKNIYSLIDKEEKKLHVKSIHDIQLIKFLKCISKTILYEDYKSGIDQIKNILKLTYIEGSNPCGTEFSIMFMYGYFLLLDNQKEEAYNYLKNLKKYCNTIDFFYTRQIIPRFYVFLVLACLDTSNLDECFEYLDFSIDYSKKYNKLSVLPELYFLKSELYYRLKKEEEFKILYNKALTLYELTKHSDDEYFHTFVKNRLIKLKNELNT